MEVMSYTEVRKKLASTIEMVNANHSPVLITRQNGEKAVLMGLADYESYQESLYLMGNPVNAERLNKGISEIESGLAVRHDLLEA